MHMASEKIILTLNHNANTNHNPKPKPKPNIYISVSTWLITAIQLQLDQSRIQYGYLFPAIKIKLHFEMYPVVIWLVCYVSVI